MADEETLSPEEKALRTLDAALAERQAEDRRYRDYDDGKHKLSFATSRFRKTFGGLFAAFSDNWCPLVVDASAERLFVEGFRSWNGEADAEAWDLWQRNYLDADSRLAQREAILLGRSYALVSPGRDGAKITVESADECIVAHRAGSRRERSYGLKRWLDEESERVFATLYMPSGALKFQTADKAANLGDPRETEWEQREGVTHFERHSMGAVQLVPLLNAPDMRREGRSDLRQVIPVQDAVNKLVADMIVASEFAAFRQRWATGIEIPTDGDTGQPLNEKRFLASVARVWAVEDSEAKFGEFAASDLKNYVNAVEMLIQHLAARTRTPPHYLLGQSGAFPSGESLKSTETGLVAKVKDKMMDFGEGWEEVIRLAFRAQGDEARGKDYRLETIWRDPESRTRGEVVDAAVKERELGVPREALWERIGATATERDRWRAMAEQEEAELLAAALRNGGALPGQTDAPPENEEPADPALNRARQ